MNPYVRRHFITDIIVPENLGRGMDSSPVVGALKGRFTSIRARSKELQKLSEMNVSPSAMQKNVLELTAEIPTLISSYAHAKQLLSDQGTAISLESIEPLKGLKYEVTDILKLKEALLMLLINCDAAIAYLERIEVRVPADVIDKLEAERQQIAQLEEQDIDLFKHLSKAIDEHEEGHFLAAALIAGKVANNVLNRIPGATEDEKAKFLVESKVLDPRVKDGFLKASRKARNFYSHDLLGNPEANEALGAVSDAVDLTLRYLKTRTRT